jgi:UDP-glucose 4-epimerase
VNILKCVKEFNIPNLVFSSSCSVYGNATELPVVETSPLLEAQSPYARTKQMGEQMIRDYSKVNDTQSILLRYFNPVGAHPSGLIGELPIGRPDNLVPFITQTAIGKLPKLTVFGHDYDTRDGSCIRDYIHVMDIANAHTKALQYLLAKKNQDNCEVFNLGTGNGVTVLEAIKAFEKISGVKLNYELGPRRPGDVIAIYANNTKAKEELGWVASTGIEDMMRTAWQWEVALRDRVLSN